MKDCIKLCTRYTQRVVLKIKVGIRVLSKNAKFELKINSSGLVMHEFQYKY